MDALIEASRCAIHVVDLEAVTGIRPSNLSVPRNWESNQYAVELWLHRAIERHPWRVASPSSSSDADLLFGAANLSLWCVLGRVGARRQLWGALYRTVPPLLAATPASSQPIFIARQYEGSCGPAESATNNGSSTSSPAHAILMQEEVKLSGGGGVPHTRLVSPFLVSTPSWLVGKRGGAPPPPTPPWHLRKLVFFAGHIPKPYIRDTRYTLWRQLRNESARATVLAADVACTVGAFEVCRRPEVWLQAQPARFFADFCRRDCVIDPGRGCLGADPDPSESRQPRLHAELKLKCRGYAGVNFTDELEDSKLHAGGLTQHSAHVM